MHDFFFGDAPRDGSAPSPNAWQAFGYNLDGKITSANSTDVCTLYNGAPMMNQSDGLNGIDNAWGAVAVPEIQLSTGVTNLSNVLSAAIQKGNSTMQFQIVGLSDDPQQSSNGLRAQMFLSGAYDNGTPAFDLTTDWPVLSSSVADGQSIASGARSAFPSAYINGGTFVSGTTGIMEVDVVLQGVNTPLVLHNAFFTLVHSDHADAITGTIAGVLDVTFCDELTTLEGRISSSLCSGPQLEAMLNPFRKASDILDDGTNPPGQPCTGISVGFGFNAKLVANPTKVMQVPPPPPDPCVD